VNEKGFELFTDFELSTGLSITDIIRCGNRKPGFVMITASNGDRFIGDLETGEFERESAQSVRTESRKTSGKIIRISNDKLNKLFIY
jgi:hypothetical protein